MNGNRFCDRYASREERGPKLTAWNKLSAMFWVLALVAVLGLASEEPREDLTAGMNRHQVMSWVLTDHPDYSRCTACHNGAGMLIRRELLTVAGVN